MGDRFCVILRSPRPRLALGSSPPCAPTSLRLTPASLSISREIFFCHMSDISSHLNDNKWSKSFIIWVTIEIWYNHVTAISLILENKPLLVTYYILRDYFLYCGRHSSNISGRQCFQSCVSSSLSFQGGGRSCTGLSSPPPCTGPCPILGIFILVQLGPDCVAPHPTCSNLFTMRCGMSVSGMLALDWNGFLSLI